MRIQLFQVVNAVSLHGWFPALWRWQEPPKPQELLTLWHSITSQNIHILTLSPVMCTFGYVSTKVVSRAQEDSTIAHFSTYNVRVLENCTRMWHPAISVIYCQHHECVYKQPWYIMLKYWFLEREQWQHPIKRKFLGAVRKEEREEATSDIFIAE